MSREEDRYRACN